MRPVADAGWFDDHETFLPIDARDVSPGKDDQTLFYQVKVGLENFLFEIF